MGNWDEPAWSGSFALANSLWPCKPFCNMWHQHQAHGVKISFYVNFPDIANPWFSYTAKNISLPKDGWVWFRFITFLLEKFYSINMSKILCFPWHRHSLLFLLQKSSISRMVAECLPRRLEPAPVSQLLCEHRGVKIGRVRGAPPTRGGPESPTPRWDLPQISHLCWQLLSLSSWVCIFFLRHGASLWAEEWVVVGRYVGSWFGVSRCAAGGAIASCRAKQQSRAHQHWRLLCPLGTSYLPPSPTTHTRSFVQLL